jgi:hypothetical protein
MRSVILVALSALLAAPALGQESQPLVKLPKVKRNFEAVYPPMALRERIEAVVTLELEIDEQGYVSTADVVSSSTTAEVLTSSTGVNIARPVKTSTITDYGFARAASAAGARLEFEPAEDATGPVPVRIQYNFRFKLPPPPPPPPPAIAGETPPPAPQVLNFTGTLRARGDRALLAGVVVTAFRESEDGQTAGFESVSDQEGVFKFYDLEPGEWKVLAEADGFYPFRTTEEVKAGEVTEVTYFIERGVYNPYDVLVEAQRVKKEVNRRTLTVREITRIAGTLGDPVQVVENLPGVARPPPGSGQIIVRGSGPTDTGIFINGIDIPLIYHFGGLRSVIPADVIEGIEFVPGNYSAMYGRKTGGIFDAKLKRLKPDQIHGSAEISLLDGSLYVEAPITDNLSVAVAGRRSWIDVVLNAVIPEDAGVNLSATPVYYDYQALVNFRPSATQDMQLTFLGSDDGFAAIIANPASASPQVRSGGLNFSTDFFRVMADHRYTPNETFRNEVKLAAGTDNVSFNAFNLFKFELGLTNFQLRERAEYKFSDMFTLAGGIDGLLQIADVSVLAPRPPSEGSGSMMGNNPDLDDTLFTEIQDQESLLIAPYLEATITLFEQLTLIPSLRVDYWQFLKETTLDPRIVARYQLNAEWLVKGGIGLFHQAPEPVNTDVVFGNPDLEIQRAMHYSLGAEWMPAPYLKADVTLFYKSLSNLVSNSTETVERDGMRVPLNFDNNGTGTVYGVEVFLEHKFNNNFRGWLTYTAMRATRIDSGSTEERLFDFDQTHIFGLVASYQFPENWEVGLRYRVVSGNPTTPTLTRPDANPVLNSDLDQYVQILGAVNTDRLPLFHQLDLRVDKSWIFDAWRFSAFLSLVNSYNQVNIEGYTYSFDFTQRSPQQGLPIYPILGVRGEF